MNEQNEEERPGIALPINWYTRENIQSRYATNMTIQAGQHEFVISFFETELPLLLGQPEENKQYLEQIGKVRAVCVGRIIVAADRLPDFIAVMQTTLQNYQVSRSEK